MEHPTVTVKEVLGLLPYASNTTLLARLDDRRLAVYKPDNGEQPLWDFEFGTLGSREVLTYETAAAMGHDDIVPATYVASGPMGRGSAQLFLDEDFDFDAATLVRPFLDPWTWSVAVLDIVTNNADRKFGHMIRDSSTGAYWAIDNGLTFHAESKLRTVLWGHAGCPLPQAMVEAVERLADAYGDWLGDRVTKLLSYDEAVRLGQRIDDLLDASAHPHPPTNRPAIPWPLY